MKHIKLVFTLSVLSIILPFVANAATLIETHGEAGTTEKMWVEGKKMRASITPAGEYILMDMGKKKIYIIDANKKEIVDATNFFNANKSIPGGLKVSVTHMGSGPTIAGYATEKYQLSVNGEQCEQAMLSKKALKDARLGPMLEAVSTVNFNPTPPAFLGNCEKAEALFAKRMKKLGMPLGSINPDGKMTGKVKRIVRNARLPAGGMAVPKGYRMISMEQKMQETLGRTGGPGAPAGMAPDMKTMMEQMAR